MHKKLHRKPPALGRGSYKLLSPQEAAQSKAGEPGGSVYKLQNHLRAGCR
jgi:hypothetical protein